MGEWQPWIGRQVELKHMDGGMWKVVAVSRDGWCLVEPKDPVAENLARFGDDGRVWFRKRDLKDAPTNQQETLL